MMRQAFTTKPPKPGDATLAVRLAMVEVERSLQNVYSSYTTSSGAIGGGKPYSVNGINCRRTSAVGFLEGGGRGGGYDSGSGMGRGLGGATGSNSSHGIHGSFSHMELDSSFMHTQVGHYRDISMGTEPSQSSSQPLRDTQVGDSQSQTQTQQYQPSFIEIDEDEDMPQQVPHSMTGVETDGSSEHLHTHVPSSHSMTSVETDDSTTSGSSSTESDKKSLSIELKAKGMLIYRVMVLHRALVSLFLRERLIFSVFGSIMHVVCNIPLFNNRISSVTHIDQLLSWIEMETSIVPTDGECSKGSSKQSRTKDTISNSNAWPARDRKHTMNNVLFRYSKTMQKASEYRNLHRDLMEITAPIYEINSDRKLATATRMRNSYQCLAPPSL